MFSMSSCFKGDFFLLCLLSSSFVCMSAYFVCVLFKKCKNWRNTLQKKYNMYIMYILFSSSLYVFLPVLSVWSIPTNKLGWIHTQSSSSHKLTWRQISNESIVFVRNIPKRFLQSLWKKFLVVILNRFFTKRN